MLNRVALTSSMMKTASEDERGLLERLPPEVPIEEQRLLARFTPYDDYIVLLGADMKIDSTVFLLDAAARFDADAQFVALNDDLRDALSRTVESLEPASELLRRISSAET